jgi:hypothetical protein
LPPRKVITALVTVATTVHAPHVLRLGLGSVPLAQLRPVLLQLRDVIDRFPIWSAAKTDQETGRMVCFRHRLRRLGDAARAAFVAWIMIVVNVFSIFMSQ